MLANPYQTPTTQLAVQKQQPISLRGLFLFLIAWLYPLLLVGSLYGTWLVAWYSLGHRPRPSLDDPKSIGPAVDVCYPLFSLLLVGFPAALLFGLFYQLLAAGRPWPLKTFFALLTIGIWSMTIVFLRWDPWLVAEWYLD